MANTVTTTTPTGKPEEAGLLVDTFFCFGSGAGVGSGAGFSTAEDGALRGGSSGALATDIGRGAGAGDGTALGGTDTSITGLDGCCGCIMLYVVYQITLYKLYVDLLFWIRPSFSKSSSTPASRASGTAVCNSCVVIGICEIRRNTCPRICRFDPLNTDCLV